MLRIQLTWNLGERLALLTIAPRTAAQVLHLIVSFSSVDLAEAQSTKCRLGLPINLLASGTAGLQGTYHGGEDLN